MNKLYLGIDTGRVYTKGIVIDKYNNIIASSYILTNSSPIESTKKIIKELQENINLEKYKIVSIGVTGVSKKLIGTLLNANIIRNEIQANVTGTINLYPNAKTIIEIGGTDSKIIEIKDKSISDYSIHNSCSTVRGVFISDISNKLNVDINQINNLITKSKNKIDFNERCTIYAETEIINKIGLGYKKEDIIAGLSHWLVKSFITNVLSTKYVKGPIIFTGGVSKNIIIRKELENYFNEKIIVDNNSHLINAYGMAIMARSCPREIIFNTNIDDLKIDTQIEPCKNCNKECLIVSIYKNNKLIDYWGNKCERKTGQSL